ncbi:hypothetical protein OG474_24740 [Kribbella sp. NBC_01505]|uniref:hypothetical protein n=1 Tax=Kribbella sp. NBC_01505 TaxID=2903580 RepID=UPI00386ED195
MTEVRPEDAVRLRAVTVEVAEGRSLDLVELLKAWMVHVAKIESDMSLPSSDRSVWGAHDFIAALYLRDFLGVGLSDLDEDLRARIESAVVEVDHRFSSYTEPDSSRVLQRVDRRKQPDPGWWWRRIPRSGPARDELMLYGGDDPEISRHSET